MTWWRLVSLNNGVRRVGAWSASNGLNSLWSGGRPLPKGKWNVERRTLAGAVKSSVQRMVATGSAMEMSSDVVKK